jgi:hypothetical protein
MKKKCPTNYGNGPVTALIGSFAHSTKKAPCLTGLGHNLLGCHHMSSLRRILPVGLGALASKQPGAGPAHPPPVMGDGKLLFKINNINQPLAFLFINKP